MSADNRCKYVLSFLSTATMGRKTFGTLLHEERASYRRTRAPSRQPLSDPMRGLAQFLASVEFDERRARRSELYRALGFGDRASSSSSLGSTTASSAATESFNFPASPTIQHELTTAFDSAEDRRDYRDRARRGSRSEFYRGFSDRASSSSSLDSTTASSVSLPATESFNFPASPTLNAVQPELTDPSRPVNAFTTAFDSAEDRRDRARRSRRSELYRALGISERVSSNSSLGSTTASSTATESFNLPASPAIQPELTTAFDSAEDRRDHRDRARRGSRSEFYRGFSDRASSSSSLGSRMAASVSIPATESFNFPASPTSRPVDTLTTAFDSTEDRRDYHNRLLLEVVLADIIQISGGSTTFRYAVTDPSTTFCLRKDDSVLLVGMMHRVARLVKNHGLAHGRPLCTVVECLSDGDLSPCILLVANQLVHPEFAVETIPNPLFNGAAIQALDLSVLDHMDWVPGVPLSTFRLSAT
ncbi:hypothetical protein C8R46DRAFT_1030704 [Mycena filopes]|nr:hypothetical protein C8R46DRAFT_1030704 [Mycena filopes]